MTMDGRNVGEAILLHLKRLGVEWFFANPGTEFVSIIQGFTDLPKESVPKPILAPHEFQAVSMAYGSYLATRRPQAVMTHANVGAANALIGLIACARMNIPLLYFSGMSSRTEQGVAGHRDKLIHWAQDSRDQGAGFREYVKWEVELSDPSAVYDVIDRAWAIATSEPYGPVAIKVTRDVLVSEAERSKPRTSQPMIGSPALDFAAARPLFTWLAEAKRPVVITNRLGSNPADVAAFITTVEQHGLGVITPEDFYLSFPMNHRQHLRNQNALAQADLVMVVNCDTPWYPLERGPDSGAKVVHVGPDPLFTSIPLRSHRGDLFLCSSIPSFLTALSEQKADGDLVASRLDWVQTQKLIGPGSTGSELTAEAVSSVLAEFLTDEIFVVNEMSLVPELLNCQTPGRYFRSGAASPLGWGLGCAIGLGLASKKTVIAAIGDGSLYLSPLLGSLLSASQHQVGLLLLILNNQSLGSIASGVAKFYDRPIEDFPLTSLASDFMRLERCAEIASSPGYRAQSPAELKLALGQALEFCRKERRPAVINACLFNERSNG